MQQWLNRNNYMTIVDARGLSYFQPVLMTRQALLLNPEMCQVLVDNHIAQANITRYAKKSGYKVTVRKENGDTLLEIKNYYS
jgi:TusA-related sulfurtransferase